MPKFLEDMTDAEFVCIWLYLVCLSIAAAVVVML